MSRAARRALVVVASTFALRLATLFVPLFNTDEAYLAIQGHVLAVGGRLYLDVADRKPPLVPYLYAAIFRLVGTDSLVAVHVVAALWVAATALLLARLVERRMAWSDDARTTTAMGARAGDAAAALYLVGTTAFLPAETLAANFELFLALPTVAALLVVARGRGEEAPTRARVLAGGVLVGVACLAKQQAAVALLPLLLLSLPPAPRLATVAERALVGLVGAALPVALAAWLVGARPLWFWTVAGNGGYLALDARALLADGVTGAITTAGFLAGNAALTLLVLRAARPRAATATPFTPSPASDPSLPSTGAPHPDDRAWRFAWLGASALAVAAGLRFFGHYYLQLVPPAVALAAPIAARLDERARRRLALLALLPAVAGALSGFLAPRIHGMPDYRPLANYIGSHTNQGDRILVWGHYPELHWATGRMPAWRFVHAGFLTGVSSGRDPATVSERDATPGAWELAFADLARHPPRLVVDTATAGLRGYEHHPLARYPRLRDYVERSYRRAAVVDGVTIYERIEP